MFTKHGSTKHAGWLALSFILSTGMILTTLPAAYAVPMMTNYQGTLKDKLGKPLNSVVTLTFAVYDMPASGTALWTETHPSVSVKEGAFSVVLGSKVKIPETVVQGERYLGVKVNTSAEMTPRQALVSGFFAMRAGVAESVVSGGVTTGQLGSASVTSEKVADGAVSGAKLAASAVTGDKLAANVVTTDKIANGAVTTEKLSTEVQQKLAQTGQTSVPATVATLNVTDKLKIGKNSLYLGSTTPTGTDNSIYADGSDLLLQNKDGNVQNTVINANNTGKVGIGTSNPKMKLEVWDTIKISSKDAVNQGEYENEGLFMHYDGKLRQGEILAHTNPGYSNGDYVELQLAGSPVVINNLEENEWYRYNVGIGTKTPFTKLDVESNNSEVMRFTHPLGQLYFTGHTDETLLPSSGASSTLVLRTLDTATDANTRIRMINSKNVPTFSFESYSINDASKTWNVIDSDGDLWVRYTSRGVNFVKDFTDGSNKPRVYALTLDKDGNASFGANVGIRTSASASYSLDVAGTVRATAFVQGSDKRWKKDIKPLENALSKVNKLQGVSYQWKTEEYPNNGFNDKPQVGFIAQEVEPVLPELVITDNKGFKSVAYDKMTAVLVEAVKELKAQNDALKTIVCKDHPEETICK